MAIDAHFPSDTLVFVGFSFDVALKVDTDVYNPIVAAMSVDLPIYKWAKCAGDIPGQYFADVDISEDGARVVAATCTVSMA